MKQELIVAIVVAVIGSQALSKIVDAIIEKRKEKRKKPTSVESSLMWLLQDKLDFLMTREIKNGGTSRTVKSFIHKGYNLYHSLGGNGDMASLLEAYDELEVDYEH